MEKVFEPILDKNEKIIKVYKPVKVKYITKVVLALLLPILFVLTVSLGIMYGEEEGVGALVTDPIYALIPICIAAIIYAIIVAISILEYKNLFYAYTDKRIIIRSGVIGIDFKALDMNMVGATKVKVSILDKILNKNTGTITLGSMASPMMSEGNNSAGGYVLCDIENPYETYREIKEVIEEKKSESKK